MQRATKTMVCVDCSMRIEATMAQARKHGWRFWVGGARCKACCEKESAPSVLPTPASRMQKLVRCSSCEREFVVEQEYIDGYRPGIHWTKSDKRPLPLCPGWDRAGVLLGEVAA